MRSWSIAATSGRVGVDGGKVGVWEVCAKSAGRQSSNDAALQQKARRLGRAAPGADVGEDGFAVFTGWLPDADALAESIVI